MLSGSPATRQKIQLRKALAKLTGRAAWTVESSRMSSRRRRSIVWARPGSDGIYRRHGCNVVGGGRTGGDWRATVGHGGRIGVGSSCQLDWNAAEALRPQMVVVWW